MIDWGYSFRNEELNTNISQLIVDMQEHIRSHREEFDNEFADAHTIAMRQSASVYRDFDTRLYNIFNTWVTLLGTIFGFTREIWSWPRLHYDRETEPRGIYSYIICNCESRYNNSNSVFNLSMVTSIIAPNDPHIIQAIELLQ